ncbi:DUF6232 family protein [Streptomyces sp. NBC_01092]|uniref:DUF6232 family protein n=1 Tax=Streptomyces sp. NBC_01092 TaxID=2903748 RepID=UPI00386CBC8E|nr:DUF6232 family protein [Streptomyces sp. NBC_01092]
MARRHVGEIIISRRVVQIGHEVYPLANISRVQTLQLVWGGRRATWYPLRPLFIVVLIVLGFLAAAEFIPPELPPEVGPDAEEVARRLVPPVTAVAGLIAACLLGQLVYRLFIRRPQFALVLETAGTQYTALSGTDASEIHRIKNVIVGAIENPPSQPTSVQVHGDVVMGDKAGRDQYKMSGSGNRSFT